MFSKKVKFVLLLFIVGLLSACASNATQTPALQATENVVPATAAPQTQAPANTAAATSTSAPAVQDTPAASTAAISFTKDIVPILDNKCVNCHGADRIEEGLKLQTYNDVFAGSKNGAVVVPGDAPNSLLAELVANHKMPKRGAKLTDPQVQLIIDWINQGALNN
jgi:mono/diheme cytochrome c family protein